MEHYSAIKIKGKPAFETTWLNLEGIILKEMSARVRKILYDCTYMCNITKLIETKNKGKGMGGGWCGMGEGD